MKPKVVSTFSGCGGSCLGYKRAGCEVVLASDFEENAVKTYEMNHDNPVWKANIRDMTGKKVLDFIGLEKGELDIFDGSPPCTSFSMAGQREKGWEKEYKHASETQVQRADDLFWEWIRLIHEMKPKMFVGENVRGLIMGTAKQYYHKIMHDLRKEGYEVTCLDLNAKNFEVPQSRPRIFFIGIRKDLFNGWAWPFMTHKIITVKEAIIDKPVKITEAQLEKAMQPFKTWADAPYMKMCKPGEQVSKYHPKGNSFSTVRAPLNKPCPTILAGGYQRTLHPLEDRALTTPEIVRLSSFPDDFKWISDKDGWLRMGNSVPPNLTKNVAKHLLDSFGWK